MFRSPLRARSVLAAIVLSGTIAFARAAAPQTSTVASPAVSPVSAPLSPAPPRNAAAYYSTQGSSSIDFVRRALASNRSLAAASLDVARAEARLQQALLLPNPSLDFEHTTGRFTGAPNDSSTTAGLSMPIELGGKRARRADVARAELDAVRARFQERQRQVASEVLGSYADALASLRELETTEHLNTLDEETRRFVEARVREGDAPPLELELLRVEIDRLTSRRQLLTGRLEAGLIRLRILAGSEQTTPILLREDLTVAVPPGAIPDTLDAAYAAALSARPDVQLARANERNARANAALASALAVPDVTPFARYSIERAAFDETPVGPLRDRSRLFGFGVSVTLPFFNRSQGLRAEAAAALEQARRERAFVEASAKADIESGYLRFHSTEAARKTFEEGVIDRSTRNIQTIREAYKLGEFRITDLIAEQRRLVDSQRDYTELLAERYKALADLQVALGNFTLENH